MLASSASEMSMLGAASPSTARAGNPPFRAVERPARPYKSAVQTRFTVEDAKGRLTAPGGPRTVELDTGGPPLRAGRGAVQLHHPGGA
jgi:hypothetical protein